MVDSKLYCGKCNSQRKDTVCFKCGAETFDPGPELENPKLPPIELIRHLAKDVGYAIGVHGSLERDLDLIAVPWTVGAVSKEALIEYLCVGIGARFIDGEEKPLGRYAVSLQMDGWYKLIDLSICPKIEDK